MAFTIEFSQDLHHRISVAGGPWDIEAVVDHAVEVTELLYRIRSTHSNHPLQVARYIVEDRE